jgi:hypothetical protein
MRVGDRVYRRADEEEDAPILGTISGPGYRYGEHRIDWDDGIGSDENEEDLALADERGGATDAG